MNGSGSKDLNFRVFIRVTRCHVYRKHVLVVGGLNDDVIWG